MSQQDTANANSQIDNEVSQINETRTELEKTIDSGVSSNTQVNFIDFSFLRLEVCYLEISFLFYRH